MVVVRIPREEGSPRHPTVSREGCNRGLEGGLGGNRVNEGATKMVERRR